MSQAKSAEKVVQEIRRKTRRQFSAEEKIRIVLEGLRGEESIAASVLTGVGVWYMNMNRIWAATVQTQRLLTDRCRTSGVETHAASPSWSAILSR